MGLIKAPSNLHKLPLVSRILCWIGRHDYEFVCETSHGQLLECFYCEHQKICLGKMDDVQDS